MLSVAVRGKGLVFCSAVNRRLPVPVPAAPLRMVSQVAFEVAVQEHPDVVFMFTCRKSPVARIVAADCERV